MTHLRTALLATTLLLAAQPALAQISLSSAVALAQRNDPHVKLAEADVRKAQGAMSEVKDAYIPAVGATGGVGDAVGVPLSLPVIFSVSAQSLIFNFSGRDSFRAAHNGLLAARLSLEEARIQVTEDVVTAYLSLDSAARRAAAMDEEYAHAGRLVTIVQDRLDAGQDTRLELMKARKTAADIKLAKLRAEDDVAAMQEHLTRSMGLSVLSLKTVSDSIPALPDVTSIHSSTAQTPGIRANFASAQSKLDTAFGEARYLYRPQLTFGANYSRIDTDFTNYALYYPGFKRGYSDNALSVGVQFQLPVLDFAHRARAREAAAEALHARHEAEINNNAFLEGQSKLRRSTVELAARSEAAAADLDLSAAQLDAVLAQLTAGNATTGAQILTPKDEQNARVQERQRYIEMLDAQSQLRETEVKLLRQTGQLDAWLHGALSLNSVVSPTP